MRKIKVSGCLNCPYLIKFESSALIGNTKTYTYSCAHPSFKFGKNSQIEYKYIENMEDGKEECYTQYCPNWCPLEIDYIPVNCSPVKI